METLQRHLTAEQIQTILMKCWEDESFKKSLISSPRTTIEQLTGKYINIPANVQLIVNDQSNPAYAHINIPPKPNYEDVELMEDELDIVSGGTGGNIL